MRYRVLPGLCSPLIVFTGLAGQTPDPVSVDDVVEWLAPVVLEETERAPFVAPRLAIDRDGGYLVTDPGAAQVRVYSPEGALLAYFGREGDGPGEFRNVSAVARLSNGDLCTLDFSGRLAVWTPAGDLIRDERIPINGAMGIAPMQGSTIAIVNAPMYAGPDSRDVPWVRLFDVNSLEVGARVLGLQLDDLRAAASLQGLASPTLGRRFAS